jgi:hypothetical protein
MMSDPRFVDLAARTKHIDDVNRIAGEVLATRARPGGLSRDRRADARCRAWGGADRPGAGPASSRHPPPRARESFRRTDFVIAWRGVARRSAGVVRAQSQGGLNMNPELSAAQEALPPHVGHTGLGSG